MSTNHIVCPMCGHHIDPSDQVVCGACPLQRNCQLVRCPLCGYETVDINRSKIARYVSNLLEGKLKKNDHTRADEIRR